MTDTLTSRPTGVTGARSAWPVPPLRLVLAADAAVTAANGVAYLAAAEPLADLLGLSPALLRGAGAFLVAFAVLVGAAARSPRPARAPVVAIIVINAAWAIDSLVAAAAGSGSPSTAGSVWIAVQGVAVGALGAVQALALRRRGGAS